jgi:hypothetical protein
MIKPLAQPSKWCLAVLLANVGLGLKYLSVSKLLQFITEKQNYKPKSFTTLSRVVISP